MGGAPEAEGKQPQQALMNEFTVKDQNDFALSILYALPENGSGLSAFVYF